MPRAAGFPAGRIVFHGSAKTARELSAALDYGVGRVVIGSASEVAQLAALTGRRQRVLVEVTEDSAAAEAARRIARQPALELVGVFCRIGSQRACPKRLEAAAGRLVDFTGGLGGLAELHLGSSLAMPPGPGDHGPENAAFADRLTRAIEQVCAARGIPVPRLTVEAGRPSSAGPV